MKNPPLADKPPLTTEEQFEGLATVLQLPSGKEIVLISQNPAAMREAYAIITGNTPQMYRPTQSNHVTLKPIRE